MCRQARRPLLYWKRGNLLICLIEKEYKIDKIKKYDFRMNQMNLVREILWTLRPLWRNVVVSAKRVLGFTAKTIVKRALLREVKNSTSSVLKDAERHPLVMAFVKILTSASYAAISVSMGLASTVTGLLNASVAKDFTLIVTALHALVRFVIITSTIVL